MPPASVAGRLVALLTATLAVSASAQETPGSAVWRSRLTPWVTHAGQPRPWRKDTRLAAYFEPNYPDDVLVLFANPDSGRGGQHEGMWVTVIAHDQRTDQYLGILLNEPRFLTSVVQGDNVVFRPGAPGQPPRAIAEGGDYSVAGWSDSPSPRFLGALREGIRAYRAGRNGHHMPGIERCITVLTPALQAVPAEASPDERFVGHFVLGRCLAEKYETQRAIDQFRAAIAIDSTDGDAQMALLAELSVMTHQRPGTRPVQDIAHWDDLFLRQLAVIRTRFAAHPGVADVLRLIFDASQEASVEPEWRAELPRLRRIGYAVFRWKQR